MKISEITKSKKIHMSFEIFPPKKKPQLEGIYDKINKFKDLNPDFISVTYGAGGSKKENTVEIASKIKSTYNIESMAHFTCVGHSLTDIDNMLYQLKENKIDNILALRGDPPKNDPNFDISKNVFAYANELISYIKKQNNFFIAAAAYPESHLESISIKEDLNLLKQKYDSGVDLLITQLFFENKFFYDYIDRAKSIGINCPISAGIMPIFKFDQIITIASMGLTSFPAKLINIMDKYKDNQDDLRKAGLEYSINQIQDLIDNEIDGIHIYTMNRHISTKYIIDNLDY